MAKGQGRSGREPKKPKRDKQRDKPKATPAASPIRAARGKSAAAPPDDKK